MKVEGEISPLFGFSRETLDQVIDESIIKLTEWLKTGLINDSCFPSVAFGCSCALAELNGELPKQTNYSKALLYTFDDLKKLILNVNKIKNKKIVKIKINNNKILKTSNLINLLFETIPKLNLRIDANRSLTFNEANTFINNINVQYRGYIDFIEEPCKTYEESIQFAKNTGINIALDESIREVNFKLKSDFGVTTIIIKPTLIGSLSYCRDLIKKIHLLGLNAVISSSFESSFGLTQLSRIAYWLTPNTIPGLDTIMYNDSQLIRVWPGCFLPVKQLNDLKIIWKS
ncbi:o-succinylbenzoate synthase [Candidatus Providencia siddallii]|uniref:o-succinylbenzoate synthase n=1 Tax=Candidatus Providencia siddallii TaxID=1715285 RepID=A0ABM9NNQ3_9GAMM